MNKKWLERVWDFIRRIAKIDYFAMNTILSQIKTAVHRSVILFRNFLSGLFIICLAIHFLIKDRIEAFAIVYYATPLPVLAIFAFTLGMIWLLGKRIRAARLYFIFAIGSLITWSCSSFSANSNAQEPGSLKLFFWNAAHNKRTGEITAHINGFNADLISVVEAGTHTKKARSIWKNAFPDYNVEILAGEMVLITRGKILAKASGSLGRRGRFNLLEIALNGEQYHVLLVDVDGDPLRSRAPAFDPLAKMIRSHSQANLIVMGDFNTPLDSVLFESFRRYLTHAFESGGHGFAETWPIPLPVLAIDHIWVSKKIKVVSCKLNWSWLSDHRAVAADIEPPCLWP